LSPLYERGDLEGFMTEIFNKKILKKKRSFLRNNLTKAEAILWTYIKNKQIFRQRFLRQFSINTYVVDFYCPKLHLAIEVDGETHNNIKTLLKDKIRQEKLETYGIDFLRYTNEEIYGNLDEVLDEIKSKVISLINPPSPLS
jgi:very-short-patch-repair endonuclease